MGQALGAASYSLEHGGKTYAARLLSQAEKAAYEDVLTGRALRMLESMRRVYTAGEYEDERVALLDAIKVGEFGFHGPLAVESLKTPGGMLSLAAILFGLDESEAFRLMAERREEVSAILNAVLAASLPAGRPAGGDPEKKAPPAPFTSRRS